MANPVLTIIICTYNRNQLLFKCLEALRRQTHPNETYAILVIDNFGDSTCKKIAHRFEAEYVFEEKIGLSNARNRGAIESRTDWILYIDDDGIAYPNLVEAFLNCIQNPAVNIVGGKYHHYFISPPPKWLLHYYKNPFSPSESDYFQKLKSNEFLAGGILAIRKSLLNEVGYFKNELGMSSSKFGYAEEDELQERLRVAGHSIFYNPEMEMTHLVHERKYSIKNRMLMSYAHGFASLHLKRTKTYSFFTFIIDLARITFISIPYDTARWIFRPNFFWQNAIVSIGGKYAFALGKVRALKQSKIFNN